jgi:hypothetical protein
MIRRLWLAAAVRALASWANQNLEIARICRCFECRGRIGERINAID